ncbi:MAG: sigma-70 family RNA polymerase sigma factor [Lentisphaeria bacterium]|nr:sigma-70 family RNA polymerase sigma factor [Lentisphaeria bacterium]
MYTTRKTLLQRMQNCDEISWEEFYRIYWPLVLDIGRKLGLSQDNCSDLMQEIMLDLFSGEPLLCYDPAKGRFRTYFGVLVRHKAAEMLKKSAPFDSVSKTVSGSGEPGSPVDDLPASLTGDNLGESNPFQKLFDEEYRKCLLAAAMNELRNTVEPKTYAIFEMVVLQERPQKEVARCLGINRATIDVYCSRCRKTLRRIVSDIRIENPDFNLDMPL